MSSDYTIFGRIFLYFPFATFAWIYPAFAGMEGRGERGMPTILRPDKKLVSKSHEEIMRELLLDRIYYRVQRYYFYYY